MPFILFFIQAVPVLHSHGSADLGPPSLHHPAQCNLDSSDSIGLHATSYVTKDRIALVSPGSGDLSISAPTDTLEHDVSPPVGPSQSYATPLLMLTPIHQGTNISSPPYSRIWTYTDYSG
ncbi:hypothetical protein PILCRDRAFT_829446 [Piloderma croceum F 1598]|uniref:Uncharacterized protein n=1 Tax=Piloderma croceum (strain F 1598) TaxID=765440 RepID=A0A0C3B6M1_PILCF|nr:hypothetical protein PILCRDRAFT_829446 [Piloderma croceum F 1598]